MNGISIREYALQHNRTMNAVYRRVWEGRLAARKVDGKWRILETKPTEVPKSHEARDDEKE